MTNNTFITRPEWLSTEVWPYQVQTLHIDGTPLAYTDEGDGPIILLVHDGMWSFVWGQLIDRLRKDFRVVTLDFPGSGLSPQNGTETSLERDSLLLDRFVDDLGLERMVLGVHDLGGIVGLGLAVRRPELFSGVVSMNSFAWPPHVSSLRWMLRIISSRAVTAFDVATNLIPRLTTTRFGLGANLDGAGRRAFLRGFSERDARQRFHDLLGAVAQESDFLVEIDSRLGSTLGSLPALTIYGEKNDPFGFQERFKTYFENVDEMVVAGGNHFPMADDPDAVADRIKAWYVRSVTVDDRSVTS